MIPQLKNLLILIYKICFFTTPQPLKAQANSFQIIRII